MNGVDLTHVMTIQSRDENDKINDSDDDVYRV